MPRIYDNITAQLLPALRATLETSCRADFSVGYFNLRGWKDLAPAVGRWPGGEGACCRLLVGMHRLPEDELRAAFGSSDDDELDNATANRTRKQLAEEFRRQLTIGAPTNADEVGLRELASQLRDGKLVVKLFLRHTLHAKLYLAHRVDANNPVTGYVGSSNLTFSGLAGQGELNVDVLDHDACDKLCRWFNDRWGDRWCVDISADLAKIVEESWAAERVPLPYYVYVKMAYHLSHEARAGLAEFKIPPEFRSRLLDFQTAAVKIAARHLNKRGGVLIGDVVGLGKTLMATAVARIFEDDFGFETLILCPKNLVGMWEDYRTKYRLRARVLPLSRAKELAADFPRYRLLLIDESHNLRNREGRRYRVIQDYVRRNDSKCLLLSATPYNKSYADLASQLRLFTPEDVDVGVRPERLLREIGETEFARRHQCGVRTLAAFEKSAFPDDWRELMRLYLVRRTRGFIRDNYALTDPADGRKYLLLEGGKRSPLPDRVPLRVPFTVSDSDPEDRYARLYAAGVVDAVDRLDLPRYGLGNYLADTPAADAAEAGVVNDLSRAGRRLTGFCRTNLFKRLESSGSAFVRSVERHLLRNFVTLHALVNGLRVPVGTQAADLLDERDEDENALPVEDDAAPVRGAVGYAARAADVYAAYAGRHKRRFKWVGAARFTRDLSRALERDNAELLGVLAAAGGWDPAHDRKLDALADLLTGKHAADKVLVFSQFADTVRYLDEQLRARGVTDIGAATGGDTDPTALARRFSPASNDIRGPVPGGELRVLLATDVLSEGQNLQDCAVVVNYDLPWAIIRLIQRAGRVDRIGQTAHEIRCYSFLPADGVERIINLRAKVRQRLKENAEVVGTDEAFFEDDGAQAVLDLYHEKAGVLDGDADGEVDLASYAYQIWKNATDENPGLLKLIPGMSDVVFSTKSYAPTPGEPEGVLVYARTAEGNDALSWVGLDGRAVTESQFAILRAAACNPGDPTLPRADNHHDLVRQTVERLAAEDKVVGGQLGRPSGARFRTYERLSAHVDAVKGTLFDTPALRRAVEDVLRYPLRPSANEALNRQLRSGISDAALADMVVRLREDDQLCVVEEGAGRQEAHIICSLGLSRPK